MLFRSPEISTGEETPLDIPETSTAVASKVARSQNMENIRAKQDRTRRRRMGVNIIGTLLVNYTYYLRLRTIGPEYSSN